MCRRKLMKYIVPVGAIAILVAGFSYGKLHGIPFLDGELSQGIDQSRNEGYVAFVVNEREPDDISPAPHPDINKCACKGTGYIWHGDGHQTKCPYHSEPNDDDNDKHKCACDTKKTYCNCKKAYGKCSCND